MNIMIVFPRLEDAKAIKNILVKNAYPVSHVCTTGGQAVSQMDEFGYGIVICGYRMPDMPYFELREYLPKGYEMLLLSSRERIENQGANDVMCLTKPLKIHELMATLDMMAENLRRKRRKQKHAPPQRSDREKERITEAKSLLMERNNMSEQEAYRYIQKCSMDSGTNMTETAEMILTMIR